jgi:alkylation response protein AidB-like acyl-CoA dehydrogenase
MVVVLLFVSRCVVQDVTVEPLAQTTQYLVWHGINLGAGSDDAAMVGSVTHKDGNAIINAHKCFISNAIESPYILLLLKEADIEGNPISMYFVKNDLPGITIKPMHKIGSRLGSICEVYLENVVVPDSALVGEMGNGFLQLMKNFEIERLIVAAMALGRAQCAFNDAAAYANQRVQFGQPIGTKQLIQQMITECYIKLENMRNITYHSARMKDNGQSVRIHCGLAKYYCARAGFEIVDDCMQIMGGIGYTEDHRISRLWRDIRMLRIGGGTDQIMIHTTSRQILKMFK